MIQTNNKPLITIVGPTASGKTSLAVALAGDIGGEIISADSRQVYRLMDIGTGKDLSEYKEVPYHLIDIMDAGEQYNLAIFQENFQQVLKKVRSRGNTSILCGGSGMYIQSVLQGFEFTAVPKNKELREKLECLDLREIKTIFDKLTSKQVYPTSPSTKRHFIRAIETLEWKKLESPGTEGSVDKFPTANDSLIFGLNPPAEVRRNRISNRLKLRLDNGLIEEVEMLLSNGISAEKLIHYGLEYKWTTLYLQGELDYDEFYAKLEIAIHQFAKRQMTYFRKMEKDGLKIEWLNWDDSINEQLNFIKAKISEAY